MRCWSVSFPVLISLLLNCSSGDRIAGAAGGSETTNGVTACIRHTNGAPAAGCIVRLRGTEYVSRINVLAQLAADETLRDTANVITDSDGRFTIADILPGNYFIEINDTMQTGGRGGAVLLTCTIDNQRDTIDLGTDSLRPYATLTGIFDTSGGGVQKLYAQVRGLERLATVNTGGAFSFNNLPAGCMNVRIADAVRKEHIHEMVNVKIHAGDTVNVAVSNTSTYSECIRLNTTPTGGDINGTITAFPLLIRLDASTFDFSQADQWGNDCKFTKATGAPLVHEIESWDATRQHAAIWVLIDTVHGNSDEQYIIMHWGDSATASPSDDKAVFDTAAGFSGVWHFSENPESGAHTIKDHTANGYNGTPSGNMSESNVVQGMVGKAIMLDGNDDYISMGKINVDSTYTISCWIDAGNLDMASRFIWKEFSYTLWYDAQGGGIRIEHFTDSLVWRGIYQDDSRLHPLDINTWYYLAGTYDGDKIRLYVNGELVDSTQTISDAPHASQEPLSIGGRNGEFFNGVIDEVRIENRARSAEWIRLSYRNQIYDDVVAGLNISF